MTNLQQKKEARDAALAPATLKRLWLWAPAAAGGALALLLLTAVGLPQWLLINRDQQRLSELEERREEVDLLRLQTLKTVKERQEALRQQSQLIELVAGRGDGATFLATLDLIARQTGVKLQLFELGSTAATAVAGGGPRAAAAPGAAPAPAGRGDKAPPPPDPMDQAGLSKREMLLSARGSYPQLLAFLRRMEALDLLVEQKNLSLLVAGVEPGRPPRDEKEVPPLVPEVEVKLGVTLYSKKTKQAEKPAAKSGKAPGAPG